eukprot:scaffold1211_cov169-Amphora_coffeaeformis.AAC.7
MPPQSSQQQRHERTQEYEDSPLRHSIVGTDRMAQFGGPAPTLDHQTSFLRVFAASQGPPQIVILVMLLALGFGSTIGVVRIIDIQ